MIRLAYTFAIGTVLWYSLELAAWFIGWSLERVFIAVTIGFTASIITDRIMKRFT